MKQRESIEDPSICNCSLNRRNGGLGIRAETDELLKLRGMIGQAVERARQEKLIGNALEAAVILRCDERSRPPSRTKSSRSFLS